MSSGGRQKGFDLAGSGKGMDEVEEMLRAAEDELLLNLTKNTHTTATQPSHLSLPTSSSSPLDPDLARRFESLKAPRHLPNPTAAKPAPPSSNGSVDDLMARFAALKGPDDSNAAAAGGGGVPMGEVEKIMQWAMDEARLDRSSGKGGGGVVAGEDVGAEDEDEELDEYDDEEDEEDEEEGRRRKEEEEKGRGKGGKKRFSFW